MTHQHEVSSDNNVEIPELDISHALELTVLFLLDNQSLVHVCHHPVYLSVKL